MELGKPVKHLLVDLDGTLLGNRSLAVSFDFMRHALSKLKPYGGWRKAVKVLVDINREFIKPTSKELTNDVRVVELFSKRMKVSAEEGRKILKEGVAAIFPSLEKHFYPMPGAKEFLDWAKEHYPLTLATNPVWPVEIIELRVRWAGLDPAMFTRITHVREMRACKPELAYYEQILETQGLKASDCLLIGNELKMDLPATGAGIRVFIVGPHKKLSKLKSARPETKAWRGDFSHLRKMLETNQSSES